MKRKILLLFVTMMVTVFCARAQVVLNDTNFPDANFRAALASELGINEGDEITAEKIASTTSLFIPSRSIADLTGIEYFTALTYLDCHNNRLTSLDVSKNIALTTLKCIYNQLTFLDMSKNIALTTLECTSNKLTSLDVSGCTALTKLECHFNQLTSLDVSNNTALTTLKCHWNQLTSLNVSSCIALTTLSCSSNQLTSLDVSKNTKLENLGCGSNSLTTLDVSNNTELTSLDCNGSLLNSLDVSKNTTLTELKCRVNQLTSLDVSSNTALTTLDCAFNQLISLDVSKNIALTGLDCHDNQLISLDVSKNTALTSLDCSGNQLTALDVSKNTALTSLDCSGNQLTALDVSKNTALTELDCAFNQLISLDVSRSNTALTRLYCFTNQLTSLDVSGCTALTSFYCSDNQLTSLIVSDCTSLTNLMCNCNKIKGSAMDVLIENMPTISNGFVYVINTQDENEGNVCTKTQVNVAKTKGWKVYVIEGVFFGRAYEYEGSDELILNEDNFTDSNFRSTLSQILGINEDDEITPDMIDAVTALNVSNKTISNLKGIEHFKELMVLYCQLNQIKGADMDNLIASLPTIDTSSAAPALNAPRKTSGTWGALYAYDNTAGNEGNVITTEQVADANAKGWKVYQFNGTAWEEYVGSTTGITIVENNDDATANWYTLDGKRLYGEPVTKGVYIVEMSNGLKKKVMVK